MTRGEFDEAVQSDDECKMKLLLAALRSNLFGHFTGDLLATKLNINEDRHDAVDQFAKSNALCHRFFKLFDENPSPIDRIVATLSFKGDQSLLALLDLPFELKDEELKLNENQQEILGAVDSSGCNLLMMATNVNNLDAVKLLLRCGSDFNHSNNYDRRASDICWEKKAFDCLAVLIEAGSPYPINFSIDQIYEPSDAYEIINAMIEAINTLHDQITDGETEEVKKFITTFPHIKHAFDRDNKCALTVALESEDLEIHSLLMSEGFEPGADNDYRDAYSKSEFKDEIRNLHQKYFKKAFDEPHLKRLLKMSKLSFGSKDRANCSMIIRKFFDTLNEIDEVILILKICSLSDKLKIVFDFNCNTIADMDPTSASGELGICYQNDGFVYVGAKDHETEFCRVIGYLTHEMTHYVMQLTYENNCKPYDKYDIANEIRFETIAIETKKICDENPSTDTIFTSVFNSYKEEEWHDELIVRVPELLVQLRNEPKAREAAERNTPELFQFYREKTLKDVETQSKVLLHKHLISKINNQTGIARKIENLKVEFEIVEIDLRPTVNIITSNVPQLTLVLLKQAFPSNSHIFVTLEQVAIGNILDKIVKVNAIESSTVLIVDCIGQAQKYSVILEKLLKGVRNIETIALVMTACESSKIQVNSPQIDLETFDHLWSDLTESSKVELLNQNVIFQGIKTPLNLLVEPTSGAMNFFHLVNFWDCKDFKIGHELHQTSHKFYIPRKIIGKGQEQESSTRMIISDEAGSGKSVTLFEIARKLHVAFADRWVLFVDLKCHIEAFKSVADYEKIETFEDFVVQNILKNEPKFDRELFKQMFRDGKTFVLFDGFDEISPNYKHLLLHGLKLFKTHSANQFFITTRPHLEADLEGVLGRFVFRIEEFSEESQKSFLRQHWQSVGFEMSQEDFDVLSKRLLDKFSKISNSKLVGLPLLMRMIAEIFDDPTEENLLRKVDCLSIASVFHMFVEKYFLRWTKNETEISQSENVEFQMGGGVLEVHHNIAIKHIFEGEFTSFDVDEGDADKVLRVGLIRFDKIEKTFQFIHKTFAEYFVADFVCFHLNRKNRNPSHECSKAIEILIEVARNRYDFDVIQVFLDQTLQTMKFNPSEAFCKAVANCISENVKSTNRFDFLVMSLHTRAENLASLVLSIVKHVEKEVLLKMLQSETIMRDRSALLIAALLRSSAIVSILCNIITTCTDNPKVFFQVEQHHGNLLLTAVRNRHEGVLTVLCVNLSSVLTKDEIKIMLQQKEDVQGLNIIEIASTYSTDEIFLELFSLLPKYLSRDDIKNLLLAVDVHNRNFFHRAVSHNTIKSLKLKFDAIKKYFGLEEQKIFFYQPVAAPNMFHYAADNQNDKIFETLIESTRDVLSNDEIKSMLMEKDLKGSNVLHIIARYGSEVILNELNSLLRERLSDGEITNLLLEVNSMGENCFRLAANNVKSSLQLICEIIGDLVSIEDRTRLLQQSVHKIDIIRLACGNYKTNEIVSVKAIKDLLARKEHFGRNAFQMVAFRGDVDIWNTLVSFAHARFSMDEIESFLFDCDFDGRNCLHQAVLNDSQENMIEAILETIKVVSTVEDQKEFVLQEDSDKTNVFHHAAANCKIFKCISLFDGLSTILLKEEIKEMLKKKDSYGDNILCANIKSDIDEVSLIALIAFLKKILTNNEIKDLFSDVDREGRNFFHCTVELSSKFAIKSLSEAIKGILGPNDQKKFFNVKSPNVFHLAAKNLETKIFSTTHECLKDVLTADEMKSLFQDKNSENRNVLHLICQHYATYNDVRRLNDFLQVLKGVCDANEIKNFLTSSTNNGSNCLLLAAQFKDKPFLKELISFIQSELSIEDQRSLIRKCDNDGKNIFTCASLNKVPEMAELVEYFGNEILTEAQIEEINNKNKSKCVCM